MNLAKKIRLESTLERRKKNVIDYNNILKENPKAIIFNKKRNVEIPISFKLKIALKDIKIMEQKLHEASLKY